MVNKSILKAVCTCLLSLIAFSTNAAFIVDTGAGDATGGGIALDSSQWVAGQISITNAQTVTSVEGWFGEGTEGTITAAIYTDNGSGVPVSELFSSQFILNNPSTVPTVHAWDGAFGLSWLLNPGTYWVAFEVRAGDTGSGLMPDNVPSPLDDYAFRNTSGTDWQSLSSNESLGFRVSRVPIPAAVWLFGSGLIGLIGFARRKNK